MATALDGELAASSEKSYDVITNSGEKVQVKSRLVSSPVKPGQLQLRVFRSFDFDYAVIVLLSDIDYAVMRALKVPCHVVEASSTYRAHVNAKVLFATPDIMNHPDATDLTALLQATRSAS